MSININPSGPPALETKFGAGVGVGVSVGVGVNVGVGVSVGETFGVGERRGVGVLDTSGGAFVDVGAPGVEVALEDVGVGEACVVGEGVSV